MVGFVEIPADEEPGSGSAGTQKTEGLVWKRQTAKYIAAFLFSEALFCEPPPVGPD